MIVDVILIDTVDQIDQLYTYNIHENMVVSIHIGTRVLVPFGRGNRIREALVFNLREGKISGYKYIHNIFDQGYDLSSEMIKLTIELKSYYLSSYSRLIKAMIPSGSRLKINTEYIFKNEKTQNSFDAGEFSMDQLIENGKVLLKSNYLMKNSNKYENIVVLKVSFDELQKEYKNIRPNANVQKKLIEAFIVKKSQEIEYKELHIPMNVINKFVKKGILEIKKERQFRDTIDRDIKSDSSKAHILNKEQEFAFDKINSDIQNNIHNSFLLHGVTGSGKTEVYLHLTEEALKLNKSVIVLVPEISLVPQMAQRFINRFGNNVAFYHSKMSSSEKMDEWHRIKKGEFSIVIGARSAVFSPLESIGLIIIDEEHSNSYKSESEPKYEAKYVALLRGAYHNAPVVFGSATPSIEMYSKTKNKKVFLLELNYRANLQNMPNVSLVDMRQELERGNHSIFSYELKEKIQNCINNDEQCILFINKKGYSSFISCRACGYVVKCPQCDLPLIYHKHGNFGECRICAYKTSIPKLCPECGSKYFKFFGIGTEKVEEMIQKTFYGAKTLRMDSFSMQRKNALHEAYKAILNNEFNIILGTQIVAKGHDFKNVTLVGILAADINLNVPSFNASENSFQLLTQAIGRSGRGNSQGEVVIQTYSPDHYAVLAAYEHNYNMFVEYEMGIRKAMNYPPFKQLINIIILSRDDHYAEKFSKEIAINLNKELSKYNIQIMGPGLAILEKAKGLYRYQIVIKFNEVDQKEIKGIINNICQKSFKEKVYINIDVNPVSLI